VRGYRKARGRRGPEECPAADTIGEVDGGEVAREVGRGRQGGVAVHRRPQPHLLPRVISVDAGSQERR
jgi:hypothetical protein